MDLARTAAFGVAGNFTGHLEQAGEAADFAAVEAEVGRPKGMFPTYLPAGLDRLSTWPFADRELVLPAFDADVQPEPEVALRCEVTYDAGGVVGLRPTAFAACDDTSIRRPPAPKISLKKNWGPASKGLGSWLELDRFESDGVLQHYRLACFLIRDGDCAAYGEDSPVAGYSTIFGELLDWMVDRLRHQTDVGPLESLAELLDGAARPHTVIISIGATRYTELGEGNPVRPEDQVVIVVYDQRVLGPQDVAASVAAGDRDLPGASVLWRTVRESSG